MQDCKSGPFLAHSGDSEGGVQAPRWQQNSVVAGVLSVAAQETAEATFKIPICLGSLNARTLRLTQHLNLLYFNEVKVRDSGYRGY